MFYACLQQYFGFKCISKPLVDGLEGVHVYGLVGVDVTEAGSVSDLTGAGASLPATGALAIGWRQRASNAKS